MNEEKIFYIKAENSSGGCIATGIQVIIPANSDYRKAKEIIAGRIASEMAGYFIEECINSLGIKK